MDLRRKPDVDGFWEGVANVLYQPIVHLDSDRIQFGGRVAAVEALWRPADMATIVDDELLSVRVLAAAISAEVAAPIVTVNVEGRHFADGDLFILMDSLRVAAPFITAVEVTERDGIPDVSAVARYRDAGFVVALDDVELDLVPHALDVRPDIIKLTADALQHPDRLGAAVGMAHSRGVQVVIEGIETVGDARLAAVFGAEFGQGFLWSPAVSAVDVAAMDGVAA